MPNAASTSSTMVIKVPAANPSSYSNPTFSPYGFSLDSDDDYVYILNEDDIVVARATNNKTGGTPLATQIDMQVADAQNTGVPSIPQGEGSARQYASKFSSEIARAYASRASGPWYIAFDMTISGGKGTKRYYVKIE